MKHLLFAILFITSLLNVSGALAQSRCPDPFSKTYIAPTAPAVYSGDFTAAQNGAPRSGLHGTQADHHVLCTFKLSDIGPCCDITTATLIVKVTPLGGQTYNDNLAIMYNGASEPGGCPLYSGTPATTIKNIPITGSTLANLQTSKRLSFAVQDDSRVDSAVLRVEGCCHKAPRCDAGFTLSGTITPSSNTTTFSVTATANTLDPLCGFYWRVEEIDANGNTIGTAVENPSQWWAASQIPTTTFPGYIGTGTLSGSAAGQFKQGHRYRITRGTWSGVGGGCTGWTQTSKVIYMSSAMMLQRDSARRFTIEDDTKFHVPAATINKILSEPANGKR